jgi:hypothetical protein
VLLAQLSAQGIYLLRAHFDTKEAQIEEFISKTCSAGGGAVLQCLHSICMLLGCLLFSLFFFVFFVNFLSPTICNGLFGWG